MLLFFLITRNTLPFFQLFNPFPSGSALLLSGMEKGAEIHVRKHNLGGHDTLPFCLVHILPWNTLTQEDSEIYTAYDIIDDFQKFFPIS